MYGISDFLTRISDLLGTWWHVLSLFTVAMFLSLRSLPSFSWPLWIALAWFSVHGLLLGPGNPYYTTELVLFVLPIGVGLARLSPLLRNVILCIFIATTLTLLGPRSFLLNSRTLEPFKSDPYWNTHAAAINHHLRGEEAVIVLGYPGHQLRWYLEPRVLVGRTMVRPGSPQVAPPYPTRYLLTLQDPVLAKSLGKVVYEDANLFVIKQQ